MIFKRNESHACLRRDDKCLLSHKLPYVIILCRGCKITTLGRNDMQRVVVALVAYTGQIHAAGRT